MIGIGGVEALIEMIESSGGLRTITVFGF